MNKDKVYSILFLGVGLVAVGSLIDCLFTCTEHHGLTFIQFLAAFIGLGMAVLCWCAGCAGGEPPEDIDIYT